MTYIIFYVIAIGYVAVLWKRDGCGQWIAEHSADMAAERVAYWKKRFPQ